VFAAEIDQHLERLVGAGARLLGIAGPPGCGKSTLAAALAARVPGAVVLPMDGFHLADEQLRVLGRADRKGAPDTFDAEGFLAALRRVRARAHDVYVPRFDRDLEAAIAGAIRIGIDAPLVIVEGNYLLLDRPPWNAVRSELDACWWIDVPDAVRVPRLIARHVAHGRSDTDARAWVERSDAANARLVERHRFPPDLVLDGTAFDAR
jgi:pantothenate kinase